MHTNTLDEEDVMSSGDDTLKLTTKRVRAEYVYFGSSSFVSMTLDSVSSCGLITKSYPVLLIIAGLVMFLGFGFSADFPIEAAVAIAIICIVSYFLTKGAIISICSNGGKSIEVAAKSMSRSSIIEFLDAIENEKLKCLANYR